MFKDFDELEKQMQDSIHDLKDRQLPDDDIALLVVKTIMDKFKNVNFMFMTLNNKNECQLFSDMCPVCAAEALTQACKDKGIEHFHNELTHTGKVH